MVPACAARHYLLMTQARPHRERLLPLGPTARLLHIEPSWLRSEAQANRIPCVRAGRTLLFSPLVVERILFARLREEVRGVSHG
jgi:hypothetical protein